MIFTCIMHMHNFLKCSARLNTNEVRMPKRKEKAGGSVADEFRDDDSQNTEQMNDI
jgi:hypothetical protein